MPKLKRCQELYVVGYVIGRLDEAQSKKKISDRSRKYLERKATREALHMVLMYEETLVKEYILSIREVVRREKKKAFNEMN